MKTDTKASDRLYSLDALRGIAALAVVFWHWQHFFYTGPVPPHRFARDQQPFYSLFRLCYDHGDQAVDLFFSLSGFIFFWLYARAIADRTVRPRRFFVLRFSRLYPLHSVTLLVVLLGQMAFEGIHGNSFVYLFNDAGHFALNVLFLQSVGLERGYSFNGPTWSVSVEVMLYALFFAVSWLRMNRPLVLLGLSAVGYLALTGWYAPMGRGVGSFFLGGFVYYAYAAVAPRHRRTATFTVTAAAIAMWGVTVLFAYTGHSMSEVPLLWRLSGLGAPIALFPATILALALLETQGQTLFRRLSFLGDISYSSYLWHFPLQLAFVLCTRALGLSAGFFWTPLSMLLFFLLLIPISLASFRFLEMPAQRYLRARWLRARATEAPATPGPKR
jgi:peptidoglycan/LPS O-acetylase OafA/YrhL